MTSIPGLLCLLLLGTLQAAEITATRLDFRADEQSRLRFLAQPVTWWGRNQYPVKPGERGTVLTLANPRVKYAFMLLGREDADGAWFPAVGMPKPSKANWSSTGFFEFQAGDLHSRRCSVAIGEGQDDAIVLLYRSSDFQAEARWQLLPDDDRLFFTFAANRPYTLHFTTYPSSYGGSWSAGQKLRQRFAVTPTRTLAEGKHPLQAAEYYVFLAYHYFDPAQNRGEGPCALLYHPGQSRAEVLVQNYSCRISLSGSGRCAAVLFDFHGLANTAALEYLRALSVEFQ
ncbi:MAG: hypothetical protein GX564_02040 [Oligosphaeraceae bacterium]|nr:hypothetical protein [Oligosphaeraceae bacterium]